MHYRARSYDTRTGRFLQKEPVQGLRVQNHYLYAGLDPVSSLDPTGNWRIVRREQWSYAFAYPEAGDSINSLANKVRLNANDAFWWLKVVRKKRHDQANRIIDDRDWSVDVVLSDRGEGTFWQRVQNPQDAPDMERIYLVPNVLLNVTNLTEDLDKIRGKYVGYGENILSTEVFGEDGRGAKIVHQNVENASQFDGLIKKSSQFGQIWGLSIYSHGGAGVVDFGGQVGVQVEKYTDKDFKNKDLLRYKIASLFLATCGSADGPEWYSVLSTGGSLYGFKGSVSPNGGNFERGPKPLLVCRPK